MWGEGVWRMMQKMLAHPAAHHAGLVLSGAGKQILQSLRRYALQQNADLDGSAFAFQAICCSDASLDFAAAIYLANAYSDWTTFVATWYYR